MSSKDEIIYFRAEPRLAKAIRYGARLNELNVSDYIRTLLRKTLALEVTPVPDYAEHPSVDTEIVNSPETLP